jgi:diguanylate cyclase (GGDEF)-like protein
MRALRGLLPALLVLIALPVAVTLVDDGTLDLVTGRYALLVFAAGGVLAAVFHRSRVVIGSAGLAYLYQVRGGELGQGGEVAFSTALVVLVGVLAVSRDRGLRSRIGLLQVSASIGALVVAHQLLLDPVAVDGFHTIGLLPDFVAGALGLPDVTIVTSVLAILVATFVVVRWGGPVERTLLAAQPLVLIASHPALATSDASVLLMGAGLLLSLSVVEQSYSMAYRDELTKLPGRRALMRELAEATPPFAVAMVDVDHFKKFNDKHGHDVGDQVLQMVATHLAASPDATAYRYGGEEFTLVFPRLTRDEAVAPADAVRTSVQDATFSLRGWTRPRKKPAEAKKKKPRKRRSLAVTVSIGLADTSVGDGSPEAILKKADQALYRAKEEGRNRVST